MIMFGISLFFSIWFISLIIVRVIYHQDISFANFVIMSVAVIALIISIMRM